MHEQDVTRQIESLRRMSVAELRQRHLELFGEPATSRHRHHLFRRMAWRLQAKAYGGLSQRAMKRAQEIVDEAQLRIVPPRDFQPQPLPPAEPRLPMAGAVLTRRYKGRLHQVMILDKGFEYQGQAYRSLSAVAKVITGSHWNGNLFFGLREAKGRNKSA